MTAGPKVECQKCGTIIQSKRRHHMVRCTCGSIAIDGGDEYTKLTGDLKDIKFVKDKNCSEWVPINKELL